MTVQFGFTEEDLEPLVLLVADGDSAGIVSWLQVHIIRHHDMHALLEFLGRLIFKTWPMALTKGVDVGRDDYWAMQQGPNASPVSVASTQMITASLNEDWDTLTALINAALLQPEEFHGAVTAHLLAALGDGLKAITSDDEIGRDR